MDFDVKVNMNPDSVIEARLGIEEGGRIHKFFTNQCALHMDKYVPFDSSDLATTVVDGGMVTGNVEVDRIIYEQPYAKYQYYGMRKDGSHAIIHRTRDKHRLATSYWDQVMVSAEMSDIVEEVQNELKKGGS